MTDRLPRTRLTAAFERRVAAVVGAAGGADMPVVVACSGGPDSTAALVATTRADTARRVVAAYFDHGMRPHAEIEADRLFVEGLAASVGAEFALGMAGESPPTSEAGARDARYRWLAAVCLEVSATHGVTGHTLDDQAETVLLRLTRGAGLPGVAGMEAEAKWPVPGTPALRLLRPLLAVRRPEVVAYLEALGIAPRFDATNELVTFHRNRVRHRVLPELRAINPRVDQALVRFAALARRDDAALEEWVRREFASVVTLEGGTARLARRELRALPDAVASRLLRRAAASVGLRPDSDQVEAMLRLVRRRGARLSLAGGSFEVESESAVLRRLAGISAGDSA
ncbi:MAG: tRNA lysidine(34) synthetase TilS [Dehalococcoidia bacterium]